MNTVFEDAGGPLSRTEFVYFDVIILCSKSFMSFITNYIVKDLLIFRGFDSIFQ